MAFNRRSSLDPNLREFVDIDGITIADLAEGSIVLCAEGSDVLTLVDRTCAVADQTTIYVQVFFQVRRPEFIKSLRVKFKARRVVSIVDGYCSAVVPLKKLKALADSPDVVGVEGVRYFRPALDRTGPLVWGGQPAGAEAAGVGHVQQALREDGDVVIGIVDYGLDFRLADFCAEGSTEKSRIERIWDQSLAMKRGERVPKKYGYGVEYSKSAIDRALKEQNEGNDPFSIVRHDPTKANADLFGHGTAVTGIAAGNGQSDAPDAVRRFAGIARRARIVFVHLDRQSMIRQVGTSSGSLSNSVCVAHAIAYCFEKADELGLPCVVNLSMGFNSGGHDGNTILEWIIDALLRKPGRAVVAASGNEARPQSGDKGGHCLLALHPGTTAELNWLHGSEQFLGPKVGVVLKGDPSENEIEIWYRAGGGVAVTLTAPDGESIPNVVLPDNKQVRHVFRGGTGELAVITSDGRTPWRGASRIHIRLGPGKGDRIRFGAWKVLLENQDPDPAAPAVQIDAWIERTLPIQQDDAGRSRLWGNDVTDRCSLTIPATSRRIIAVGATGPLDDSGKVAGIYARSGHGPTRDGRFKPDVVAPGVNVCAPAPIAPDGSNRALFTGTSAAAPHVTGVVARLLARNAYLTTGDIHEVLVRTAVMPEPVKAKSTSLTVAGQEVWWHPQWGFGVVNGARAVSFLDNDEFRTPDAKGTEPLDAGPPAPV